MEIKIVGKYMEGGETPRWYRKYAPLSFYYIGDRGTITKQETKYGIECLPPCVEIRSSSVESVRNKLITMISKLASKAVSEQTDEQGYIIKLFVRTDLVSLSQNYHFMNLAIAITSSDPDLDEKEWEESKKTNFKLSKVPQLLDFKVLEVAGVLLT